IAKLSNETGKKIFWTIMTSADNHSLIIRYFQSTLKDGKYFGILEPNQVLFIAQENYPAIKKDNETVDIYITDSGKLYTAAGGHGGFYTVAKAASDEIKNKFNHQVEEILACNIENVIFNYRMGDLDFIAGWLGFKHRRNDQITGLATIKSTPQELMGILAKGDNVEQVVEYNHPNFSVFRAFAYESKKGDIYFVKDNRNRILILDYSNLKKIINGSAEEENWMTTIDFDKKTGESRGGRLVSGFTLLGWGEISENDELYLTDSQVDVVTISKGPYRKNEIEGIVGKPLLKYRLGNTNIFVISRSFVDLVCNYPEISLSEEYKTGDTPYPNVKKIERSIFGPLANIRAYENLIGEMIGISVVEAPREECFEPIKTERDIEGVKTALENFFKLHPELKENNENNS
ncbi:MAG: hypothetical protein ACPL4K_02500, partial [Candidatus Margulisiibacteriota bacterium]